MRVKHMSVDEGLKLAIDVVSQFLSLLLLVITQRYVVHLNQMYASYTFRNTNK